MTAYLFGIAEGKFEVKAIHQFIRDYWHEWFPHLPRYQNFNRRMNFLAEAFQALSGLLMAEKSIDEAVLSHIVDSMPIIVAKQKRSNKATAARGICDKGYCSTKGMYYYGVKLHALGQKRVKSLPKMCMLRIAPASENDISVAKEWLSEVRNMDIFADKMYINQAWFAELAERGVRVITPVKLKIGQKVLDSFDKLYSSAVSRARQAIESLFNWIQTKTFIQSASRVRSDRGLIAFIFARLAALSFFYS